MRDEKLAKKAGAQNVDGEMEPRKTKIVMGDCVIKVGEELEQE